MARRSEDPSADRGGASDGDDLERLALPFVFGMAVGLAFGRTVGSYLVGIAVGIALVAGLYVLAVRIAS